MSNAVNALVYFFASIGEVVVGALLILALFLIGRKVWSKLV